MNLEMKNISKSFGPVQALIDVSFSVGPGEIHGLLGENGAGKTTLMNILGGGLPPDSGTIVIDGTEVHGMTPRKSNELGIRFIHQELSLCNDLKVYQNMFLGEEFTNRQIIRKQDEISRAQEVLDTLRTDIAATDLVGELTTAQKQLVEIARALLFKSELIIMDEPTTALNTQEIENLFSIMRSQKTQGVSFIYISHKMPELFEICDRYTVLRDGRFIQSGLFRDIDERQATELLIGKTFTKEVVKDQYAPSVSDTVALSVKGLCGELFHDVSFDLHKGEIAVVTGLQGSGMDELATALFGATPVTAGAIELQSGRLSLKQISHVMRSGVGMIPRNRKERGILPDLSISKNNSLAYFTALHRKPFVSDKEESERFENNRRRMDIKVGDPDDPITSLSGGNQQKVIIGKWLNIDADVYILDNPTQGIDVGAKFAIYRLINDIAGQGKAILVFTNEYPEIVQVADRCMVMYKGTIVKEFERKDFSEVAIMAYSTGTSMAEGTDDGTSPIMHGGPHCDTHDMNENDTKEQNS